MNTVYRSHSTRTGSLVIFFFGSENLRGDEICILKRDTEVDVP